MVTVMPYFLKLVTNKLYETKIVTSYFFFIKNDGNSYLRIIFTLFL